MGNCGLRPAGLPPWFLGGTQQIPRRLSPGNCFGGVAQSAEGRKLFVGCTQQMPRRLSPGNRFGGAARSAGGYLSGTLRQNPKTVLWPPGFHLFPADCITPPEQFPGDNRRGICWVPPRNQGERPHEGSPQFPISRRSPPKSFEFRRGGEIPLIAGGVPNKAIFQNEGLLQSKPSF